MILCLAAEQGYSALCKVSCTIPPFLVGHEGPLQASVISTTWGEAKVVTFKCFVFLTYPICPCNRAWLYKNVQVKLSEPMKLMKMVLISFGVRGGIHRFSWTAINHNDGVKPSILATEFVILTSTFAKWGLGEKRKLGKKASNVWKQNHKPNRVTQDFLRCWDPATKIFVLCMLWKKYTL